MSGKKLKLRSPHQHLLLRRQSLQLLPLPHPRRQSLLLALPQQPRPLRLPCLLSQKQSLRRFLRRNQSRVLRTARPNHPPAQHLLEFDNPHQAFHEALHRQSLEVAGEVARRQLLLQAVVV